MLILEGSNNFIHDINHIINNLVFYSEAIELMENALDNYVVFGLGNNIPFLRSVYRNKNFRSGNYSTKFIGEEYPNGFKGVELSKPDINRLIATTALMHYQRKEQSVLVEDDEDVDSEIFDKNIITLDNSKEPYEVTVTTNEDGDYEVHILSLSSTSAKPETVTLTSFDWDSEEPLAYVSFKGTSTAAPEISVQYEGRNLNTYNIRYYGSQRSVSVFTHREVIKYYTKC